MVEWNYNLLSGLKDYIKTAGEDKNRLYQECLFNVMDILTARGDFLKDANLQNRNIQFMSDIAYGLATSQHDRFMELFQRYMPNTVIERLLYILKPQTCDVIGLNGRMILMTMAMLPLLDGDAPGKLAPLHASFHISNSSSEDASDDMETDVDDLWEKEKRFISEELASITQKDITVSLCRLLAWQQNYGVSAHTMWAEVFCSIWKNATEDQRGVITAALRTLLEKSQKPMYAVPNTIQNVLDAAFQCEPAMKIPPETIRYLARTFNTWHTSFEWIARESPDSEDLFWMGKMYEDISEPDHAAALLTKSFAKCVSAQEIKDALTLQKFEAYHGSRQIYMNLMNRVLKNEIPRGKLGAHEANFWESNWIECTRRLTQWEFLVEFAKAQDAEMLDLWTEMVWRLGRVDQFKDAINRNPGHSQLVSRAIHHIHVNALCGINDNKNQVLQSCYDCLLKNWQLLPSLSSRAHAKLENSLQQLVEAQEGAQIFARIKEFDVKLGLYGNKLQQLHTQIQQLQQQQPQLPPQQQQQQQQQLQQLQQQYQHYQQQKQHDLVGMLQSLKGVFNVWEQRLPNVWEDVMFWNDIFVWRQMVLNESHRCLTAVYQQHQQQLQQFIGNNEMFLQQQYLGWHIASLADVYLKHDLPDVCLYILIRINKLKNIKISEAHRKLRDHVKCELSLGNPRQAFEVLQKINLSLFDQQNTADFMRLKGVLYSQLKHPEEANYCFSTAAQTCPMSTSAWSSWAKFLEDRMFNISSSDNQANRSQSSQLIPVTDPSRLAEEAMAAYIQALRCSTEIDSVQRYGKSPISYAAHALWLLGQSNAGSSVQTAFTTGIARVPNWTWIPWTQQLLDMVLAERTHVVASDLLLRISASYHNSVFSPVFSYACHVHSRGNPGEIARVDGLVSAMRAQRPFLFSRLETCSLEAARALVPNPLETLVVRLEQLLLRASDINLSNIAANSAATSASAFKEATKVILSELEAAGGQVSTVVIPPFKAVFEPIVDKLCSALSSAPSPSQSNGELKAVTLELMNTCIQWISQLRTTSTIPGNNSRIRGLGCSSSAVNTRPVPVRDISPLLAESYNLRHLELPGQYHTQGEPSPRRVIMISYMHPEVFIMPSAAHYQRCYGIVGNNGKAYFYRVLSSLHCPEDAWTRHDASRDQFVRAVSTALHNEVFVRSRGIYLRPPAAVPMSDTVQIVNLPLTMISFWQVYEFWSRKNPHVDASLMSDSGALHHAMVAQHYHPLITATESAGEISMLTTLCNEVPDHVVRDYISYCSASLEARFELARCFRLNFVARAAINLVLATHASTMSQFLVLADTSGAETLNYHAPYSGINFCDPQPGVIQPRLRLTRNVMGVLSEPGGFGATKDALVATLLSLQNKREKLGLFLRMYYLNEYNIKASLQPPATPLEPNDDHHTARMQHDAALARLDSLCPKKFSGISDEQRILQTDANIAKLMEEAMSPSNIISFQHSWYPWV